ncbi:TPA: hypothetical protein N0F65_006018 [Lagenidium giganteum]|uniref:SCP domain-containing protein n=1 Tax=Lagenidium giganteum TaxID=4803 RepID=A0AAV2Z7X3_9STRA|nr:TPA: hypothetical protein N0F65_006018 [Lagenidium giganteum]
MKRQPTLLALAVVAVLTLTPAAESRHVRLPPRTLNPPPSKAPPTTTSPAPTTAAPIPTLKPTPTSTSTSTSSTPTPTPTVKTPSPQPTTQPVPTPPLTTAPAPTTASPPTTSPPTTSPQTTAPPASTPQPTTVSPPKATTFQIDLVNAVNAERAKVQLAPLCLNAKLIAAAQGHSDDMAAKNYMDHRGSDGSSPSSRIDAQGYWWMAMGENVAAGQSNVAAVMKAWMGDKGHRDNILGAFTHVGAGNSYSAASKYHHYWTQDFAWSDVESCSS